MAKYINPHTDFGFKKLFGEEGSKLLLKDFLNCDVFFDKLAFVFVEMPRFQKTEGELKTHFDKWLYFLKNLESFDRIPEILNEEVFLEGFRKAEIANIMKKKEINMRKA